MKRVVSRRMELKRYRYAVVLLVFGLPSLAAAAVAAATAEAATKQSTVCGAGTLHDSTNDVCTCDTVVADCESGSLLGSDDDLKTVHIAGIMDTGNFHWADEIFNVTISLLNNRSDGFHDDIFLDETVTIEYELANDDCEETAATRAYWDLRRTTEGAPIHGIVGSRCSGASIAVARIASLEGVAQVSPISSSAILSNDEEFPYFSRLVSPSDHRGAVGSLIAMLRSFSFSRVSIIAADTQYGKDTMNEFRKAWSGDHFDENGALLWKGRVSYANTVSLLPSGDIDEESARQVLLGVPTEDPTVNSRVIVLISQEEQGFPILKLANEMGFQKDTIWTGIAWIARDSFIGTEWLPEYPGYLGMAPFRNQDAVVKEYIRLVREVQLSYGRQPWDGLDHYAMEYVADAIVTLVRALSNVPASQRRNGTAITNEIRQLTMNGVSGPVSFTENGDRADPLFSMYNYQKLPDGTFDWIEIGTSGTNASTTKFFVERGDICFAEVGCNLAEFPSDVYAIPKPKTPTWVYVVIPIILTLLLGLAFKYWRKSVNHKATMESMAAMQERMNELEKINDKIGDIDREVDDAIKKKDELILRRGSLLNRPDTWSNSNKVLVEVDPCDDQYWDVSDQLQKTMRTAHISKLWRVQNSSLWSYYSFHMHRLLKSKIETNESAAWHGTSSMDPSVVYNDRQDGFMMQYSERGFWGRGIYFAEKSKYSHEFAFKPSQLSTSQARRVDRPVGQDDEREVFLVKLLVGESIEMDRDASAAMKMECAALTVPPTNRKTKMKYNTVTGSSGDSRVWVVYENGRAYPDYLVRYYEGRRDPTRTPFRTRKEAAKGRSRLAFRKSTATSATMSEYTDDPSLARLWTEDGSTPMNSSNRELETEKPIAAIEHDALEANETATEYRNLEAGMVVPDSSRWLWEFLNAESQWREYDPFHQTTLEVAYQEFLLNDNHATVRVDGSGSDEVREVDFKAMVQVDLHHPETPRVLIRRRPENRDKIWR